MRRARSCNKREMKVSTIIFTPLTLGNRTRQYLSICMIDILRLKRFASDNLPSCSRLRSVLLSERDQLKANDFLAKMDIWMTLLNLETANA